MGSTIRGPRRFNVTAFWEGVLAGYGIAVPVGAIAVLIVDVGLRRGFGSGFMAGAGAATADLFYASLAALAGEAMAAALAPFAQSLRIASALVLLGLGGLGLWRARQTAPHQGAKPTPGNGHSYVRPFAHFLGLTLLNPLTVAYFAALVLGGNAGSVVTIADRAAFVVGAGLASLSWQTLLAGVGTLGKQYLSPRVQRYTTIGGNLVVMGLGLRIVVRILT